MTPVQAKKALLKQLNDCKKKIAADRDELRTLVEMWSDLITDCDEAEESLESAIDALSRRL